MQVSLDKGLYTQTENVDYYCEAFKSKPLQRVIDEAKVKGRFLKTCGNKKAKTYIFLKSGMVLCSSLATETIAKRLTSVSSCNT